MNSNRDNNQKKDTFINPYLTKGKVAILIDGALFKTANIKTDKR